MSEHEDKYKFGAHLICHRCLSGFNYRPDRGCISVDGYYIEKDEYQICEQEGSREPISLELDMKKLRCRVCKNVGEFGTFELEPDLM